MSRNCTPRFTERPKRALSVREVAETTPFGKTTIYKLINSGELRSVRIHGRRVVLSESLDELLARSG